MEKRKKGGAIVKLIAWSLVAILLIMLMIGMMVSADNGFLTFGSFSLLGGYFYDDCELYGVGNAEYDGETVDSIDISWESGKVNVKIWDGDSFKVEEDGRIENDENTMRTRVDDGKLTVKFAKSGVRIFNKSYSKELTVWIPSAYAEKVKVIKVESASADISVDGSFTAAEGNEAQDLLCLHKLEVDNVSGKTDVKCKSVSVLDVSSVSGDVSVCGEVDQASVEAVSARIELEGEIKYADIEAVSGAVMIKNYNTLPEGVDVETVSGEVKLSLPKVESGFHAELDSISGKIRGSSTGKYYSYGSGKAEYSFDTISGNVIIELE